MKRIILLAVLVAGIGFTSCETSQSSTGTSADSSMMNQSDRSAMSTDSSSTMSSGADTSRMGGDTSTTKKDSIPQ